MPQDPIVWIVLIVVAAVLIALLGALAMRSGRHLKITRNSLEINKSAADTQTEEKDSIRVAAGVAVKRARTGDIAGIKGDSASSAGTDIEVARDAQIEDAEVGDIVGVKQSRHRDKS
jgi:hypothetical protein